MKYYFPQDRVLTKDIITKFKEKDRAENARKIKLYDYYKGKHSILQRTYEDASKPNNKVVNPYANYITTMMTGYFIGEPVGYVSQDEAVLDALNGVAFDDDSKIWRIMATTKK